MRNNENQRDRFNRTSGNGGKIGFIDFLLFAVGFMLIAMIMKGTWRIIPQLSAAENGGALLSCALGVFFGNFDFVKNHFGIVAIGIGCITVITAIISLFIRKLILERKQK